MAVRLRKLLYNRATAWVWWLLTAAYMGLIFYLSEQTGDEIHLVAPDYILHALAFGGLSFLVYSALRAGGVSSLHAHLAAVVGALMYGISDELHQIAVPGRHPSLSDVVADLVGAIAVQLLIRGVAWFYAWRRRGLEKR